MALTVEDGTGLAAADALISLAYATTYHANRGNTAWAAESDDTLKENAIRRASTWITEAFRWKGAPVNGRTQALGWPRAYVIDREGYSVASNAVPDEIQRATAEVALRELATVGAMTPDFTPADEVESEKIGPIMVKYSLTQTGAQAQVPQITAVWNIVGGLTDGSAGGNRLAGATSRV